MASKDLDRENLTGIATVLTNRKYSEYSRF